MLWHEHLPVCMRAFSGRGIHVLISKSRDGEWAAQACARMGYRVHRGSSSAAGDGKAFGGLRALARAAGAGGAADTAGRAGVAGDDGAMAGKRFALIGMALDGPRGPRRVPKPGSLWLAQRYSLPVIPVAVEARRAFRLGTWDRTLIPWPFSRVEIHLGETLHPRSREDIEEAMRKRQDGIDEKNQDLGVP